VCVCVCVCVWKRKKELDPGNSFRDGFVPRDTSIAKTGLYLREKP